MKDTHSNNTKAEWLGWRDDRKRSSRECIATHRGGKVVDHYSHKHYGLHASWRPNWDKTYPGAGKIHDLRLRLVKFINSAGVTLDTPYYLVYHEVDNAWHQYKPGSEVGDPLQVPVLRVIHQDGVDIY